MSEHYSGKSGIRKSRKPAKHQHLPLPWLFPRRKKLSTDCAESQTDDQPTFSAAQRAIPCRRRRHHAAPGQPTGGTPTGRINSSFSFTRVSNSSCRLLPVVLGWFGEKGQKSGRFLAWYHRTIPPDSRHFSIES